MCGQMCGQMGTLCGRFDRVAEQRCNFDSCFLLKVGKTRSFPHCNSVLFFGIMRTFLHYTFQTRHNYVLFKFLKNTMKLLFWISEK